MLPFQIARGICATSARPVLIPKPLFIEEARRKAICISCTRQRSPSPGRLQEAINGSAALSYFVITRSSPGVVTVGSAGAILPSILAFTKVLFSPYEDHG